MIDARHSFADVLEIFTDEHPVRDALDIAEVLAGGGGRAEFVDAAHDVLHMLLADGALVCCCGGFMRPLTPKKIHLGCGDRIIPGWLNVDGREAEGVQLVADVRSLPMIATGAAYVVYASHILEHFGRNEVPKVLTEWGRILRSGGTLRLAVPNLAVWFQIYKETGDLDLCLGSIYGRQDYLGNFHQCGFDERTLTRTLIAAGFENVRRWDWRKMEHAGIDDFSQAYYPHLRKDTGLLTSLNLEATKI